MTLKATEYTEVVELRRWKCQHETHKHDTESGANRCIAKSLSAAKKRSWAMRRIEALRAVMSTQTLAEASALMGVSTERCMALAHRAARDSLAPDVLSGPVPDDAYWSGGAADFRKHKTFWAAQADALETKLSA